MKDVILLVVGLGLVIKGADLVVEGASALARRLRVSDLAIGLTIVAFGASLPELGTSAVAARKGNSEIAIGNMVGSNIFNIFLLLGVSALIKPLPILSADNLHVGAVGLASVVLLVFMRTGKRLVLDSLEAVLFLFLYVLYLATTVGYGRPG